MYQEFLGFDQLLSEIIGSFFTLAHVGPIINIVTQALRPQPTQASFTRGCFAFTWEIRGHVLFKGLATCLKYRSTREKQRCLTRAQKIRQQREGLNADHLVPPQMPFRATHGTIQGIKSSHSVLLIFSGRDQRPGRNCWVPVAAHEISSLLT